MKLIYIFITISLVTKVAHKRVFTTKEFLQRLFPPVSSGFTTAVIGSAEKFNSGFVENRCKPFTSVLIEQPL
jgi:hypothetical protein